MPPGAFVVILYCVVIEVLILRRDGIFFSIGDLTEATKDTLILDLLSQLQGAFEVYAELS